MYKLTLSLIAAGAALCFTGCDEDRYGYYDDHPAAYGSAYDSDVDFYYVSSRPYSRSYGPLYLRDGHYYYSRGGSYVVYDRPTRVYRNTNYRVVNRDVNVRNVRYNNERVVRDSRSTREYRGSRSGADYRSTRSDDRSRRVIREAPRSEYRQRETRGTPVRVSGARAGATKVKVVEKKRKKDRDD